MQLRWARGSIANQGDNLLATRVVTQRDGAGSKDRKKSPGRAIPLPCLVQVAIDGDRSTPEWVVGQFVPLRRRGNCQCSPALTIEQHGVRGNLHQYAIPTTLITGRSEVAPSRDHAKVGPLGLSTQVDESQEAHQRNEELHSPPPSTARIAFVRRLGLLRTVPCTAMSV